MSSPLPTELWSQLMFRRNGYRIRLSTASVCKDLLTNSHVKLARAPLEELFQDLDSVIFDRRTTTNSRRIT